MCFVVSAGLVLSIATTSTDPAFAGPEQLLPLLFKTRTNLNPAIEQSMEEALATLGLTIPALLRDGNYKEADDLLRKLQADAEASIQAERELVRALWIITDIDDTDLGPLYEEWV